MRRLRPRPTALIRREQVRLEQVVKERGERERRGAEAAARAKSSARAWTATLRQIMRKTHNALRSEWRLHKDDSTSDGLPGVTYYEIRVDDDGRVWHREFRRAKP